MWAVPVVDTLRMDEPDFFGEVLSHVPDALAFHGVTTFERRVRERAADILWSSVPLQKGKLLRECWSDTDYGSQGD
jgi:hypothetical protein